MKKLALLLALLLVAGIGLWQASQPSQDAHTETAGHDCPAKGEPAPPAPIPAEPPAPMSVERPAPVATAVPPASVVRSEPIQPARRKLSVNDVVLPGNRIYDAEFGLSAIYPTAGASRCGAALGRDAGENTIFLRPPEGSRRDRELYYRAMATVRRST